MIRMQDFETDGKVNWEAYDRAKINEGETCYKCRAYIMFSKGYRSLCSNCTLLTNAEEIVHQSIIRCPHCRHEEIAYDVEKIWADGEHDIFCNSCDKEYTVSTQVSFKFTSPSLIEQHE